MMLENSAAIVDGLKYAMRISGAANGVIAIEAHSSQSANVRLNNEKHI